ncbi:unnamed protein product [Ectocarpus sp. 8 AP-2014]
MRSRSNTSSRRSRSNSGGKAGSSGNLGVIAAKARGEQHTRSSSVVDLVDILEKKELSAAEVMVIRQSMVQTQDRLFVATNPNEVGGGTGAGSAERKSSAASAAAMGEVVGDDSMVVGKGIMIKGDVDNCATLIVEGYFEGNFRGGFLAVPKGGKYVGMADGRDVPSNVHCVHARSWGCHVRASGKIEGMVRYNDVKLEQGGSMVGDIQQGTKP